MPGNVGLDVHNPMPRARSFEVDVPNAGNARALILSTISYLETTSLNTNCEIA